MKIIRERNEERAERICHVLELGNPAQSDEALQGEAAADNVAIAIDEDLLSWLYIAPGYEARENVLDLLRWALELLGPKAWALIQAREGAAQRLLEGSDAEILESFPNGAPGPAGISAYLVQMR